MDIEYYPEPSEKPLSLPNGAILLLEPMVESRAAEWLTLGANSLFSCVVDQMNVFLGDHHVTAK